MGLHITETGTFFRWNQNRQAIGDLPGNTVNTTYEVGPLTPEQIEHVSACEEYVAGLDVVLMGLPTDKAREL